MKIEAISKKNFGIKFKGKWYNVVGNAKNYIDKFNKDDDVEVKFNDKNEIIYIKKKGEKDIYNTLDEIKKELSKLSKKLDSLFEFKEGDKVDNDNGK